MVTSRTVAAFTADTIVGVYGVAELGVVGKLVHLDPFDGLTGGPAFTNREKLQGLGPNLAMAVHTGLRSRDVRVGCFLYVRVAILATDAQLTRVKAVAVFNRLFGCVSDVRVFGREVVPDEKYGEDATRKRAREGQVGQYVRLSGEYLRHPGKGLSMVWNHRARQLNDPRLAIEVRSC